MTARPQEIREFLDVAVELARSAGDHTLGYYGHLVDYDAKGDGSPVTRADREAEQLIRKHLALRYPDHAVLGEEFGETNQGARVRWILDPIDATLSFMRGVPLYGVLIGVEVDEEPAVGVCHFPPLRETVAAGVGLGCTWNGKPCRVSPVDKLDDAVVLTTDLRTIETSARDPGWSDLVARARIARTWGDCYGHALVATGRAEVMVDPIMNVWDCAPFLPILTEAGGRFTSREGVATIHGGSAIASNGVLHDEVLRVLRGA
ncbi:MAG TPA: inositol monophosphatase family protein [Longimicrobiales bacterium]|nr:inositol monophosphatase family protein [Longimicrobiales bacterium]